MTRRVSSFAGETAAVEWWFATLLGMAIAALYWNASQVLLIP